MIAETVFCAIVFITLVSAVMAVALENVFYNALSLILCLFGVACIFIYLNSEFLAVMEVIIYIGAIAIAIIFAIMLSRPMSQKKEPRSKTKIIRSMAIASVFFIGLVQVLCNSEWVNNVSDDMRDYSLRALGKSLLTVNVLPFEAVSLVLLIAIIGALLISETHKGKH